VNLQAGLQQLAHDLHLDARALLAYAEEDRIGGWHENPEQRRWMTGSLWEVKGQILYALVRAIKPEHVVEIGTWFGCSATHILEAMANNHRG
jgi:predicted O-methyltransferase YrrM